LLEKGDYCAMSNQLSHKTIAAHLIGFALIAITVSGLIAPHNLTAQVQAGSAFLKVTPGARDRSMAGSLTGSIDNFYSIYANPGAVGFLREWHWAAGYTEWFAGSYHTGINYSRRIWTPWSRQTNLAFGIQYQGIRQFDSTNKQEKAVDAGDLILSVGYGNPLTFLSPNLSFGLNTKFYHSRLASYEASAWVYDFGLLYKSDRISFSLPLISYGYITGGVAVNNLGKPVTYLDTKTPLPRIFRAGAALHLGSHSGAQVQIAADFRKERDERTRFNLGAELAWRYNLALRGGYSFQSNALGRLSFGLSIKMDDQSALFTNVPGKNKALGVDIAGLEKGDVFSGIYQATANWYPVSPETFELLQPLSGVNISSSQVKFEWSTSEDPDLYDELKYFFLLDRQESPMSSAAGLSQMAAEALRPGANFQEMMASARETFFVVKELIAEQNEIGQKTFEISELPWGEYYWTVVAADQDNHFQFAGKHTPHVGHFRVLPDLIITDIHFAPSQRLEIGDYQGKLHLSIANIGAAAAPSFNLAIYDSAMSQFGVLAANDHSVGFSQKYLMEDIVVPQLAAGKDTLLKVDWKTGHQGLHRISMVADRDDVLREFNEQNNRLFRDFHSVPKGFFAADSVVITQIDSLYEYELPFIPKVYFKQNSAEIKEFSSSLVYSPLMTLVKRIKADASVYLHLQGVWDEENGETRQIADQRAKSVGERLIQLGLQKEKMKIAASTSKLFDEQDTKDSGDYGWVTSEKRFVNISVFRNEDSERQDARFFYSVPVSLPKSKIYQPVRFGYEFQNYSIVAKAEAILLLGSNKLQVFDLAKSTDRDSVVWFLSDLQRKELENRTIQYKVEIEDTLGRKFSSKLTDLKLKTRKRNLLNKRIIVGVAEFREEKPGEKLYWEIIASRVNDRLEHGNIAFAGIVGHACAIGDSSYNARLSIARSESFYSEFQKRYPKLVFRINRDYGEIQLSGHGEQEPFGMLVDKALFLETLRLHNLDEFKKITYELVTNRKDDPEFPFTFRLRPEGIYIQSDNETVFGRQINRRIEIRLEPREHDLQKQYTLLPQ